MDRMITEALIDAFEIELRADEKSENTIAKYLHDVRLFSAFAAARHVSKAVVVEFKSTLVSTYAVTSANSIIAAVNAFLRFTGWTDCCIRQFKVQRKAFCSEEKELTKAEYIRLVNTAKQVGNDRLHLILQTICATGIRVSELRFVTVEAVRKGEAIVSSKNKIRTVFIVKKLQKCLLRYIRAKGIVTGSVFVTRTGRPVNRSNIWREMKALCGRAGVSSGKVFPHNLRHLFARVFYHFEKDIVKLADILGHSSVDTARIYITTTGAEHKRKMEHLRLII